MSGAQHDQQFLKSWITALILVPSGLLVTQVINVITVSLAKLRQMTLSMNYNINASSLS